MTGAAGHFAMFAGQWKSGLIMGKRFLVGSAFRQLGILKALRGVAIGTAGAEILLKHGIVR